MRCLKCPAQAQVEVRRHHAAFCGPHYLEFFETQVRRAIARWKMLTPQDRVLVAVSGGKDSLSLWEVLSRLGYSTTGLYIHLGIGEYSDLSQEKCQRFASERGLPLLIVDLRRHYGLGLPELARRLHRVPCSGCGLSKRYILNKEALDRGFTTVATGHNLDDEAATLLGNILHWQEGYLARQSPALEASHHRLVKRVKPLYLLSEKETASYALLRRIDYIADECPHAEGALSLLYKDALNRIELQSPGAKGQFVSGFLDKAHARFQGADQEAGSLRECLTCGYPTTGDVCNFCRMWDRALKQPQKVPVPASMPPLPNPGILVDGVPEPQVDGGEQATGY